MKKYNNPRLTNTTVSGTGMKHPRRPHVILGNPENGFIQGDIMDANAVKDAIEEADQVSKAMSEDHAYAMDQLAAGLRAMSNEDEFTSEREVTDEFTFYAGKFEGSYENETSTEESVDANGHEYVDLGLPSGTLWATMNVGANSFEDYGNYYKYGSGAEQYSVDQANYSITGRILPTSADTARQVWGGNWHMPTVEQFLELINNTTCEYFQDDFGNWTAKYIAQNGNYIILPSAGVYNDSGEYDAHWSPGIGGKYWTSSVCTYDNEELYDFSTTQSSAEAFYFVYNNTSVQTDDIGYGMPIRPVIEPSYVQTTHVVENNSKPFTMISYPYRKGNPYLYIIQSLMSNELYDIKIENNLYHYEGKGLSKIQVESKLVNAFTKFGYAPDYPNWEGLAGLTAFMDKTYKDPVTGEVIDFDNDMDVAASYYYMDQNDLKKSDVTTSLKFDESGIELFCDSTACARNGMGEGVTEEQDPITLKITIKGTVNAIKVPTTFETLINSITA